MSDTARAVALVVSVLLWSPVAPGLLRGEVAAERALLLYAGACLLALTGCAVLSGLVRAYAAEQDATEDVTDVADRRAAANPSSPPGRAAPRPADDAPAAAP